MFDTVRNAFKVKDIRNRIFIYLFYADYHPNRFTVTDSGC